jgi:hypothetical protein
MKSLIPIVLIPFTLAFGQPVGTDTRVDSDEQPVYSTQGELYWLFGWHGQSEYIGEGWWTNPIVGVFHQGDLIGYGPRDRGWLWTENSGWVYVFAVTQRSFWLYYPKDGLWVFHSIRE